MAEESFDSFTTPALEKIAAGSLRRHSAGKSTSLNTREYVPHYLRASTGSCHDLCKYGKHVVEESQVPAERKKATLVTSKEEQNAETCLSDQTERGCLERREKALLVMVKPLPISKTSLSILKTRVSYTSKAMKQDVPVCLSVKITTSKAEDSKRTTSKKPKSQTMKLAQSTNVPGGGLRSRDIKVGEAAGSNRVAVKKTISSPRPFLPRIASSKPSKQKSLKTGSRSHNENKNRKSEVKQHDQDEIQLENQEIKADSPGRRIKPGEVEHHEPNGGSEQVVLRHQDAEEKKNTKGLLFNTVIEETASKLGGMQKSKVKALVGAFEIVISLQDHKPSATAVD